MLLNHFNTNFCTFFQGKQKKCHGRQTIHLVFPPIKMPSTPPVV